jgi:putative flavoprotein involved in K+ transport
MPFPAPGGYFPTKDEMADYLEAYAARFDLPAELGVTVDELGRHGDHYSWLAGPDTGRIPITLGGPSSRR